MLHTTFSREVVALFEAPGVTDRRSASRYPLVLSLQYKVIREGRVERRGSGSTVNVSSHGVLFDADDRLPALSPIELALHWPVLLQGSCGLKLVMRGRIIRADSRAIAMIADFREFRTTRLPTQSRPLKASD